MEIDNFQSSPPSSPIQSRVETLVGVAVVSVLLKHQSNSLCLNRIIPYVIFFLFCVQYQTTSSLSSPTETTDLVQMGFSDEIFATLFDMGFPVEMIARAIKETGEAFFLLFIFLSGYMFLT